MQTIKTYATSIEANVAKIALQSAGIPSLVVGVGASMEGGLSGVQLRVPEDQVEAALTALGDA
jgi:putative signal transducing protein